MSYPAPDIAGQKKAVRIVYTIKTYIRSTVENKRSNLYIPFGHRIGALAPAGQ